MFLNDPKFTIGNDAEFILYDELRYHSERFNKIIFIPPRFKTDFASIPRLFQRLIPVNGNHRLPAVVHDFMYSKKGVIGDFVYTRADCDAIFLDAMKEKKVPFWKRQLMHKAVRIGGKFFWDK